MQGGFRTSMIINISNMTSTQWKNSMFFVVRHAITAVCHAITNVGSSRKMTEKKPQSWDFVTQNRLSAIASFRLFPKLMSALNITGISQY